MYVEKETINKLFTEASDRTVAQKLVKLYNEVKIFKTVQDKSQKLVNLAQTDAAKDTQDVLQKAEATVQRYIHSKFKRFANDKFISGISENII